MAGPGDEGLLHLRRILLVTLLVLFVSIVTVACSPDGIPPQVSPEPSPTADVAADQNRATEDSFASQRERLVAEGVIAWGITDRDVVRVMGIVPRHEFVPAEYLDQAYANHPLPIGYGQTISQPFIVALMTQALEVSEGQRVLEIGTGSAYQAAVLSELGVQVYSIEIIQELAQAAQERLERLGYSDIKTRHADGYYGWPEEAPFDAIMVTAAPDHVPQPLLAQLKVGGVMVIPIGPVGGYQELWRVVRVSEDGFETMSLGGVSFVPLTRVD